MYQHIWDTIRPIIRSTVSHRWYHRSLAALRRELVSILHQQRHRLSPNEDFHRTVAGFYRLVRGLPGRQLAGQTIHQIHRRYILRAHRPSIHLGERHEAHINLSQTSSDDQLLGV